MRRTFEAIGEWVLKNTPETDSKVWLWLSGIAVVVNIASGAIHLGTWLSAANFFMAGLSLQMFLDVLHERTFQYHKREMERINAELAEVAKSVGDACRVLIETPITDAIRNEKPNTPSMH